MKLDQLRDKSAKDLQKRADKLRDKIATARMNRYVAESKNVKEISALKKELAQCMTLINDGQEPSVNSGEDK